MTDLEIETAIDAEFNRLRVASYFNGSYCVDLIQCNSVKRGLAEIMIQGDSSNCDAIAFLEKLRRLEPEKPIEGETPDEWFDRNWEWTSNGIANIERETRC